MSDNSLRSTSRRSFVKYGALSTGALVGAGGATTNVGVQSGESDDDPVKQGVMYPYQLTPERRATVVEAGLDWRADRFDEVYQANVIAYDHAPSYRAFLFTPAAATVEADQAIELGTVRGSPAADGTRFVTVGLESGSTAGE